MRPGQTTPAAKSRSGQAASTTAVGSPLRRRKDWKSAAHSAYHSIWRWCSSAGPRAAILGWRLAIAQASRAAAWASAAGPAVVGRTVPGEVQIPADRA